MLGYFMEMHYKYEEHAKANQTKPKQRYDMVKQAQEHVEMDTT